MSRNSRPHLERCVRVVSYYLRNYRALASATPQIKNIISPLGKEACCTCDTHFRIIPLCRFLENDNVTQPLTGSGSPRHLQLSKVNCKCFWLSIEIATKYELSRVNETNLSVTNGLEADISLPHCLATRISSSAHKSNQRAEISGENHNAPLRVFLWVVYLRFVISVEPHHNNFK